MKVITKGNGWTLRKTCKGCQAVLEIEAEDINYEVSAEDARSQQYENEIEGTYSVDCPECGLTLPIKSKDIPKLIQNKIKTA